MNLLCLQTDITWEDKAANHARVTRLLERARPEPGSLVVLPEMFATGFSMDVNRISEGDPGDTTRVLANLARHHRCGILAGRVTRGADGRGHNESVFLDPEGSIAARYTKMQPFSLGGETQHYQAGDKPVIFEFGGFRIAPFVCYDLRFPELFRWAVDLGAELFVVIANWPVTRIDHWTTLLRARAIENQSYVVGVNRVGTDPRYQYNGHSLVVDPWGAPLMVAGDHECTLAVTLDPARLAGWRRDFPALRDRRPAYGPNSKS
jgi:predicted amidohydrolase